MLFFAATLGEQLMPWLTRLFGEHSGDALSLLEIMGINILLSGDNAVVIALACRSLPPRKRTIAIALGVIAAITLRVVFTLGLQSVMGWPFVNLAGGVMLLFIAIQLLVEAHDDDKILADSKTLAGAVWTITLADVVMSLDNVLAIAGAAHGKPWLIFFGLALSIPMIVGGATLIISLLTRFPVLVWAGAALLGWVAGELILGERLLATTYAGWATSLGIAPLSMPTLGGALGASLVILIGLIVHVRRRNTGVPTV